MHPRWGGVSREGVCCCSGAHRVHNNKCLSSGFPGEAELPAHYWVLRQHLVFDRCCPAILVVGCGVW